MGINPEYARKMTLTIEKGSQPNQNFYIYTKSTDDDVLPSNQDGSEMTKDFLTHLQ